MPILKMSKRHSFIIDPDLVIRYIDRDVDPSMDSDNMIKQLKKLQENK